MKRTKSMIFNETEESRELYLYAINDRTTYNHYKECEKNLLRKVKKGTYDSDKATDLMYYVATTASNEYKKDFGYGFGVGDRFTVAVMLVSYFEQDFC